jgi:hypothetical protein
MSGGAPELKAGGPSLGKTALLPSDVDARTPRGKEGVRGGTMGFPALNEWGYSCRLVDLIPKLL